MSVNAIGGPSPENQERDIQQPKQNLTINSVFSKDSDGGEAITQNEYAQLSDQDKGIVDGWRELIDTYIGKDTELTRYNVETAKLQQTKEEMTQFGEDCEYKFSIINQCAKKIGMKYTEVMDQLYSLGIDFFKSSREDVENGLLEIEHRVLKQQIE